ncbi:MAG: response regulator transcription factor [Blautia sp.]|nr:response regulator transcription factor [Lachnoclostridium sp.]MCM1212465.1 response regulator transcription factor [Blautia sp.]
MFPINILLVDDHTLFAKSLEIALSDYPEIETLKSVHDISLLDDFLKTNPPDILLMDINLKNIEPEKLIPLLSRIAKGETLFLQNLPLLEELTDSEEQILRLIAGGMKRKDIADKLYISERTLSNHLQHIFEKLGVSSSVEAVTKAIRLGYLPPLC